MICYANWEITKMLNILNIQMLGGLFVGASYYS